MYALKLRVGSNICVSVNANNPSMNFISLHPESLHPYIKLEQHTHNFEQDLIQITYFLLITLSYKLTCKDIQAR